MGASEPAAMSAVVRAAAEHRDPATTAAELARLPELDIDGTTASAGMLAALAPILDALPAVRAVTIAAPGDAGDDRVQAVIALYRQCRRRDAAFAVDFTLDGGADAFAALGKRPTSLAPVLDVTRTLRAAGVPVRWWVPVVAPLAYRLEALFSLAIDEWADPLLAPTETGSSADRVVPLDDDAVRFVDDFVTYRLLEEEAAALPRVRRAYYDALRETLGPHGAAAPTPSRVVARLALGASSGRWELTRAVRGDHQSLDTVAETAAPDAVAMSGAEGPRAVAGVLAEGAAAAAVWAVTQLQALGRQRRAAAPRTLPRVLVIGAYGGEHIGDAAILGGVLLRMHQRYGTRDAILVSQRPAHTRHLVPMLETPVRVKVEEYLQSTLEGLIAQVDGVVFAGGPLMDLPKQLVKHLYAVSLARRHGRPFVAEGIGAGPFLRRPSFWTARRLVRMAERISVRTAEDGRQPLVRDLQPEVGRDPAFDYLESRRHGLTRIPEVDWRWLDRLLRDTEGRTLVGINLRPIRSDYTVGATGDRRAEYTRFVETRFEERLAEAMRRFQKSAARTPSFIFFPMNAIQFGSSDLRSAYRLKRLLRGDVDFRIWEGDASVDGVIALLRQVDIAITMRFHATIYALSQGCRVIGVDYRIGKRDKVAAVLTDAGHPEDCARVDEMTTEWLVERLLGSSHAARSSLSAEPHPHDSGESRLLQVLPLAPR